MANELIKDFISVAEENGDIITVVCSNGYSKDVGYTPEEYDRLVNMILKYEIKSVLYNDSNTLTININSTYNEKIILYI